jgi:hypothetical protein
MANAWASNMQDKINKEVIAIRVFHNCLCVYFKQGSCRFFSKEGLDWGITGSIYFITNNFNINNISTRLLEQYKSLIMWTAEYINANYVRRLWLQLEYKIKYS